MEARKDKESLEGKTNAKVWGGRRLLNGGAARQAGRLAGRVSDNATMYACMQGSYMDNPVQSSVILLPSWLVS